MIQVNYLKLNNFNYLTKDSFELIKSMIQANFKRSFFPSENTDCNNKKRLKLSCNDYAEITYKFNASNAKSASTNDTDDTMSESVSDLIRDIENFNLKRNNKMNEMYYPNKENLKVKYTSKTLL